MNADWRLHLAGSLLTFSLRMGLAWAVCVCLNALFRRPDQRFRLWLSYSTGCAIYWVTVIIDVITNPLQSGPVAFAPLGPIRIILSSGWGKGLDLAASLLAVLYVVVVIILLARMSLLNAKLRELVRFGQPPSAAFAAATRELCQEMGIKRCDMLVLPVITSPATVYWWNPQILWPEICHKAEYLSESMQIMRHELVHIRRQDYLISKIENIICATLFFNPLIWFAKRRMQIERELASDLAVVEARPDDHRADYAASLAHLARMKREVKDGLAVTFPTPASSLKKRIRSLLVTSAEPSGAGQLGQITLALVVTLAGFLVSVRWLSLEFKMVQKPSISRNSERHPGVAGALGSTPSR